MRNKDGTVKLPLTIVSNLANWTANTAPVIYLEQLSSCRHVQDSVGGEMKCNLGEGAQSRPYRRLPHRFADLEQFCPLLTASWLANQLPVWESRVGIAACKCASADVG